MIFSICGSNFKPDAAKINSDAKVTIKDEESCKKLANNLDTIGNMYLLKDGACVQSFHYAEFDATVESQDDGKI